MKKLLFIIILSFSFSAHSQTYVKVNAITTLLTIPNAGIETDLGKKTTFQLDFLALPWESIYGRRLQFYMTTAEFRYHFNEKFNGIYAGGHIGGTKYNFQKWTYLNTDYYQKGIGYSLGVTIGYEKKLSNKIMLDCFVGGGWHQGFYKGYLISTGERYDGATHYNKSGDRFPYKGGVMVSYKLN